MGFKSLSLVAGEKNQSTEYSCDALVHDSDSCRAARSIISCSCFLSKVESATEHRLCKIAFCFVCCLFRFTGGKLQVGDQCHIFQLHNPPCVDVNLGLLKKTSPRTHKTHTSVAIETLVSDSNQDPNQESIRHVPPLRLRSCTRNTGF